MDNFSQYRLNEITQRIATLDTINPLWRESFDVEFMHAIFNALNDYSMLCNARPTTAKQSDEISDAMTFIAMSIYTSVERVIKRQRIANNA